MRALPLAGLLVPALSFTGCSGGEEPAPAESSTAPVTGSAPPRPAFATLVVDHPCPRSGARFGQSVAIVDIDGDGERELAVGALGDSAVYVLRLARNNRGFSYVLHRTLAATGDVHCPTTRDGTQFGSALAAGNLDGDAAEELVTSAPHAQVAGSSRAGQVSIFGLGGGVVTLVPGVEDEGLYGTSLACGDFDGDGVDDLAVGAPQALVGDVTAGRVVIHFSPISPDGRTLALDNPSPVANGNFGHVVAAGDWNGDGATDLVVSAIGNTVGGHAYAGEVLVFLGPLDDGSRVAVPHAARELPPERVVRLVDPHPSDDPPRFGMHLAQRGPRIAVGSPRKDREGVVDTGLATLFAGESASLHPHPRPFPDAILGFRVALVDLLGDDQPDLAVVSLPAEGVSPEHPDEPFRNRGVYVWEAGSAAPPLHLRAEPRSQDHFAQGLASGQLLPGGYEELVLGDSTFDVQGTRRTDNTGRVVIYVRD